MLYLKNPRRADPRSILSSVSSVVCVGLIYNAPLPYSVERSGSDSGGSGLGALGGTATPGRASERDTANSGPATQSRAWISRYAWGRDYHKVMRTRLERLRNAIEQLAPAVETRVYVDTGPVVERAFARLSGIGWTGKNTCLINQQKGSWFFIGVILTNLEIEPDTPAFDRCGSCRRCLDACPTGALIEPYVMDASRCIAYFNIELKGSIPSEYRTAMGANVFGCDICQDVCPWNWGSGSVRDSANRSMGRPATTSLAEFQPITIGPAAANASDAHIPIPDHRKSNPAPRHFSPFNPRLEDLASLTEADFRRIFRDSPLKRPKHRGWLRNLCVVMGNSGDRRFLPWLEEMRLHESPVVREHAEWAIQKLG